MFNAVRCSIWKNWLGCKFSYRPVFLMVSTFCNQCFGWNSHNNASAFMLQSHWIKTSAHGVKGLPSTHCLSFSACPDSVCTTPHVTKHSAISYLPNHFSVEAHHLLDILAINVPARAFIGIVCIYGLDEPELVVRIVAITPSFDFPLSET